MLLKPVEQSHGEAVAGHGTLQSHTGFIILATLQMKILAKVALN